MSSLDRRLAYRNATIECPLSGIRLVSCPLRSCWHWREASPGHCSLLAGRTLNPPIGVEDGGQLLDAAVKVRDAFSYFVSAGKCTFCEAAFTVDFCEDHQACSDRNYYYHLATIRPLFTSAVGNLPSKSLFWNSVAQPGISAAVSLLTDIDPDNLDILSRSS